jgi:predicted porin
MCTKTYTFFFIALNSINKQEKIMKKILIASAVAAALITGTATAAGPTLYGKVHLSVDYLDNGGSGYSKYKEVAVQSNASRIGVKGSEDIGNGMKAGYLIEWEVDMVGDGNGLVARNRAVMLGGSYGTLLVGQWDTPMKVLGRKTDLFNDQIGDLRNMTSFNLRGIDPVYTIDTRWANVIQYKTPTMSGVNAVVAYSADTQTDGKTSNGDNSDNAGVSLAINYDNGPVMLGAGYEQTRSAGYDGLAKTYFADQKAWRVAAGYDITQNWEAIASYTDIDNAAMVDNADFRIATIGTAYKMSNNKLKLQYAYRDNNSSPNVTELFDNSNKKDAGAQMIAVGVDHAMSKRTTLYAAYAYTKNDKMSPTTPWLSGGDHDTNAPGAIGKNSQAVSLGIIHNF